MIIHAPTGNTRKAKGWIQEATKPMLYNRGPNVVWMIPNDK